MQQLEMKSDTILIVSVINSTIRSMHRYNKVVVSRRTYA